MKDMLRELLGAPQNAEAVARMSLLERLLISMKENPAHNTALLESNAYRLTPELAADARQVYKRAIDTQRYGLAQLATMVATRIYLRMGDRYNGLNSFFDFHQLRYMAANTVEEYSAVQQDTDDFIQKAKEIEALDLIFQGYLLSANCCFFSAPLAQEHRLKTDLLLHALSDLLGAAEYKSAPSDDLWFDQFVSLLAALFTDIEHDELQILDDIEQGQKESGANDSGDRSLQGAETPEEKPEERKSGEEDAREQEAAAAEAAFNALLQEAAQMAERLIPVDFMARDGLEKSISVASSLATLSYRFGDAKIGSARLDIAIDRADELIEQSGDYQPWVDAVFQRYIQTRDTGGSVTELTELRRMLRERLGKFRGQFLSRGGRLWAAQKLDYIYGELLQDELTEKNAYTMELFSSIEAAKARALLDQMRIAVKELPTRALHEQAVVIERQLLSFAPEVEEPDETPEQKLLGEEMRIVTRLPIGDFSEQDQAKRQKLLMSLEALYETYQAGFTGIQSTAQAEEIMQALQPDEVFIEYAIPFHWVHASYALVIIVLTKDQVQGIHCPLDQMLGWEDAFSLAADGRQPVAYSLLGNLVIHARLAIQQQREAEAQEALKELYRFLIQPMLDEHIQLEGRKCIIVPHGMLHQVPFVALLSDTGRYLVEDTAITIAPSASVWLKQREQSRPHITSFLGFASPDLPYAHLPALPYSEKELVGISKSLVSLHCTTYTHAQATEEAFLAQAEGKNILHLATHGDFPEQDAIDLHRILLAPTTAQDGRVNAEEVRSMHLQAARLVVLSICNGGLYRIGPGDEPYGLISALLIAGVENIIGPLWPLKDDMGYFFMLEFYKHLLKAGPAEALQHTCKTFIQDQAYLRDWAGIILVGSGKSWTEAHPV